MPHYLYSTACGGSYGSSAYVSDQCSAYIIKFSFFFFSNTQVVALNHDVSLSIFLFALHDFDWLSFHSNLVMAKVPPRIAGPRSRSRIMA